MREIHNAIGDFHFNEPDFDECGGRTFRRVMVPKAVVRKIVEATLAVHEERRALAHHAEHTADGAGKGE